MGGEEGSWTEEEKETPSFPCQNGNDDDESGVGRPPPPPLCVCCREIGDSHGIRIVISEGLKYNENIERYK